jgi:site-specific recombinase XerD
MAPLKPVCERKNMRKDGTALIFIQYCYSAERRTNLNTEIAIPPAFWNKKRLCISNDLPLVYGSAEHLNKEIKRMFRLAEDIIDFTAKRSIVNRGKFVKEAFDPNLDLATLEQNGGKIKIVVDAEANKVNLDLYFQIDDYIISKEKNVSAETIGVFNQMKEQLKAFEIFTGKAINFESFDYDFYERFVDFLSFDYQQRRRKDVIKGLKINTIGKTIKQLRIFLRNRMRKKIIPFIDLSDFKAMEEETDAIYLTENEIRQISTVDLSSNPHLEKYRHLLVFACLTGLRFSDFTLIEANDIRDKKLYKKQEKSNHWVVVPLKEEAYNIFSKEFRKEIPVVTNPDFNYYIKEVGKLADITQLITFSYKKGNKDIVETKPKYAWITSHTGRRSFCTNEFLAGTPPKLIMQLSGHKKEKDFYRYIRIFAEEAALQIEKIWKEREELLKLSKGKIERRCIR